MGGNMGFSYILEREIRGACVCPDMSHRVAKDEKHSLTPGLLYFIMIRADLLLERRTRTQLMCHLKFNWKRHISVVLSHFIYSNTYSYMQTVIITYIHCCCGIDISVASGDFFFLFFLSLHSRLQELWLCCLGGTRRTKGHLHNTLYFCDSIRWH